ncbi:YhgE/Pip family protein [Xylanimonas ulmi]|uniref:Putative membrane protein n=1 Tax=Xylanimonas ulmi TaxID=228973 RepID=A0A4Q7M718_9MICO|nr:YhgE/Pip family protein [Xylanibacterium ulmi]RZS62442.1 putative membrane protein [Xylanibacterium ulmi]
MNALTRTGARAGVWRLAAVALLPLAVLGLLLTALWDPADRLDTVRAAIVNNDEPVTVNGQYVPLGRQLAAGLVSGVAPATEQTPKAVPASDASYQWEVTNQEQAAAGLADGTFAAVVTIPKDFSAAATSFGGDDPSQARQATIDVATPPGGRVADAVLARVVASTATTVMGSSLTQTYVDNVLVGFNTLGEQLGQAADGASQLADGATSAADGASQLADGAGLVADGATSAAGGAAQLADGAGRLASGARAASSGASALAGGAGQLADGASSASGGASALAGGADQLAGGASQLAGGIGQSASGAQAAAAGGDKLAAGARGVSDGVAQLDAGFAQINVAIPQVPDPDTLPWLDDLDGMSDRIGQALTALVTACGATPPAIDADLCAQLVALNLAELQQDFEDLGGASGALEKVRDLRGQLTTTAQGVKDLSDAATKVADGMEEAAAGQHELADGLGRLHGAANTVASGATDLAGGARDLAGGVGQIADAASGVSAGATQVSSGVRALATGATGVSGGARDLASGVGDLAAGAHGVASGATGLATGVGELVGGADQLADGLGQAVDQIPVYSDGERATLASVVADPVKAPGDDTLDTGSTGPLFAVVALWLGALGLTTVVRPSRSRVLGATRGAVRLALADLALPALIAAGTGAVVGVVIAAVEHLSVGGWLGAIGLGMLTSLVFVALHQGFCLLLGDLARGVSLLMAVLVIATGVVATVPGWLDGVADLLAIGAAREALVGLVVPAAGGVGAAVIGLVLWGVAGLGLAVFATARARVTRVGRLLTATV